MSIFNPLGINNSGEEIKKRMGYLVYYFINVSFYIYITNKRTGPQGNK